MENRVEELADRPDGFMPQSAKPFYKLIPLHELISVLLGSSMSSKKVWGVYNNLIEKYKNELDILINIEKETLMKDNVDEKLIKLIINNRIGNLKVKPGYDGEYGKLEIGERQEKLF